MSAIGFLRCVNPASLEFWALSCFPRPAPKQNLLTISKAFSTSNINHSDSPNKDFKVNPQYINRNPRCLEQAGIAPKPLGWQLQNPSRTYHHKIKFDISARNIIAEIIHNSGKVVVSASTKEKAIKAHLHSCNDKSAALNLGRILAHRCLQAGITRVKYQFQIADRQSERMEVFLSALRSNKLIISEKNTFKPHYIPGIDYERPNRYGEKKEWKDDYQI